MNLPIDGCKVGHGIRQNARPRCHGIAQSLWASLTVGRAVSMVGRAAIGTVIALSGAALAYQWGEATVRCLMPMMQAILQDLLPEFRLAVFELQKTSGQVQLHVLALLVRPLQIGHRVVDQPVIANAHVALGALWQPIALAVATATLWPRSSRALVPCRERAWRL